MRGTQRGTGTGNGNGGIGDPLVFLDLFIVHLFDDMGNILKVCPQFIFTMDGGMIIKNEET